MLTVKQSCLFTLLTRAVEIWAAMEFELIPFIHSFRPFL